MIASSAALSISKIPFLGPLGACRLSRVDGAFVLFPSYEQRDAGDFNLILGGKKMRSI
jgi:polyribonucleotide nucleotidyltransferase